MGRFDNFSSRKLAARLLMPRLNVEFYDSSEQYRTIIDGLVSEGVLGFCLFGGNAVQTRNLTFKLNAIAETPLLFSADYEYGLPMRLDEGTGFPHSMALGHTGKTENAFEVGKMIAEEAKSIGVSWNFAPVCDANSNSKNPIINIRAYSEDFEICGAFASEFIKGTQSSKVLACAKHFPGHGDVDVDSHLALPVVNKSLEEIEHKELNPFKMAIANGVKSVMIAHLAMPLIDDSGMPASLSKKVINDILKDKLGFRGIVITDALDMKAISDKYSSGEAVVLAIKAGNDIALMPENPIEALDSLQKFIEESIDNKNTALISANKLLKYIDFCGLLNPKKSSESIDPTFVNHEKKALEIAYRAIENQKITFNKWVEDDSVIVSLAFLQTEKDMNTASNFFKYLSQIFEQNIDFGYIDDTMTEEQLTDLRSQVADADLFIFSYFYKSRAYLGNIGFANKIKEIRDRLAMGRNYVEIFFGNPYLADEIGAENKLLTYSDSLSSVAATIMKIADKEPIFDDIYNK